MKANNLYIYFGPMFSGKSKKLIETYINSKTNKLIFKPKIDTRTVDIVKSRAGIETKAISLEKIEEVFDYIKNINEPIEELFFDEFFMFKGDLLKAIDKLSENNFKLHIASLDKNFLGKDFPEIKYLLNIIPKENQFKLMGWCHICRKDSHWTVRFSNGKLDDPHSPLIVVDDGTGNIIYQTRCELHKDYPHLK